MEPDPGGELQEEEEVLLPLSATLMGDQSSVDVEIRILQLEPVVQTIHGSVQFVVREKKKSCWSAVFALVLYVHMRVRDRKKITR